MNKIPEIFQIVFDMSPGLICMVDTLGNVVLINKSGAQQLGYTQNKIVGNNLTNEYLHGTHISSTFWNDLKSTVNETKILSLKHKTGQKRSWEFTGRYINFKNNNYYLILGNDCTDKIEAQKELEITDKLYDLNLNRLHKTLLDLQKAKTLAEETANIKQQFLANVSHEIRTPMNAIIGFSNILLKSNLGSQDLQYVSAIKKSGDNLMNIINEILDLSKLESGNFSFDEVDFDLIEILESVKTLFELRITDKELDFDYELQNKIPTNINGDPSRLYQILVNLVGNAIKFTEKGFVKIKIELVENINEVLKLRFLVIDSGIGIEENKLERVFDSFTQASNETTRKYGGTGLGLTICKQMVELQGGKIFAKSVFGSGSTFIFELPYKHQEKANTKQKVNKPQTYYSAKDNLGRYKILIVEDNEINILLATKIIEDWGFEYSVAVNGIKAIEKLDNEHYDLVLMDVQMPEMDGYQATKNIRNLNSSYQNIPIIATTAHAAKDEAEKAFASGMNDYISKPFNLEVLLQKILKLINNEKNENKFSDTPNNKLTNLDYLRRVAAGDEVFVKKMIALFIEQTPSAIEKIKDDLQNNNWDEFRSKIHKLMPSISFMGITALNKELHQIDETKLTPQNLSVYNWVIEQLELVINQSCIELNKFIDEISSK